MPPSRSGMNSTSEPEPDSQQQVSASRKPKSRPQNPSKPRKIPKGLRGMPGILYYGVRLADIHTVGETPAVILPIASQSNSGPLVSDTSGQHQLPVSGPDPEIYSDDAIYYPTLPNFPVPFVQNDQCESSSSHTDAFFTENNLGQSYGTSNHHQASNIPRPRTDFGMGYDGSCYPHSFPDPNQVYPTPHFMSPNAQMTAMPTASNDMPYYDETSFPGNFPQDDLAMIDYWSRNDDPSYWPLS